jgi:hypothetical protein
VVSARAIEVTVRVAEKNVERSVLKCCLLEATAKADNAAATQVIINEGSQWNVRVKRDERGGRMA